MNDASTFRRIWHPPGRYEDRPSDRRVTFLELFFDLVFVVVISQLAHRLAAHPSWAGVGWFVFLFYAIGSSWANGTLYHDLHGTDDVSARVFTFSQMLAVAVMAAFIADIPGPGSAPFALAFAANTLVLVVLWFRTGFHDASHRPASIPYSVAYLVSAVLFVASVAVEGVGRYWIWAAGLAVQLGGLLIGFRRWTPPEQQEGTAVIAATPSLIERNGLFVIIVLGEVIIGAVDGMAEVATQDRGVVWIGLLGVLVAVGLWWCYFDLASHRAPASERTQLWMYLHMVLVIAIAAGGAGVLNTVEHANEPIPDAVRWLLVGSLAVAVTTVAAISMTLRIRRRLIEVYRPAEISLLASGALSLAIGLTDLGARGTLIALVVLLAAPVATGIVVWLKNTESDTITVE